MYTGGDFMVKINGEAKNAAGLTISTWLKQAGYDARAIAVEYNEKILPKADYDTTIMQNGDVVEIVCFMGGGC